MKVALIAGALPLGGSTTFMLFLAVGLKSIGVDVEVFSFTSGNPLAAEFRSAGIQVYACDEQREIYEDRLQSLYRALSVFAPAVAIAVLGMESYELLRYLPSGVLRVGVILDMFIRPRLFVPKYSESMDHVVVIAHYLMDEVRPREGHPPVTYIQLGIPISGNIAPREPNLNGRLRLIYYGRLDDSKGVDMFPKITAALEKRNVPYQWTIHGTGTKEDYLRHVLSHEVREGTVSFSGPISSELLSSRVRAHDIYILASTNEGGPLTLLESMRLGLVPICGDIPGLVQDVITSENGFRVPRDKPEAYAEAIARLHSDRALLERMSQAAQATITKELSAEAMAHRYIRFFESAKPTNSAVWPEQVHVQPIVGQSPFRYGAIARSVRRLGKRLRARLQ
jgi:glycosyltransferase involved in cell wall biosynthesis